MSTHHSSGSSSDLLDIVHHEHTHLRRLFDDLLTNFESLQSERLGEVQEIELINSAAEDLDVVLEDMLEHFNQEEEVFFVELEERFPPLRPRIEKLVKAHETMSQRMRWLKEQTRKDPKELRRNVAIILDVVRTMAQLVEEHTKDETELFEMALENVSGDERKAMLERMRQI